MKLHLEAAEVGEYLKKHEVKPSYQRMRIFQYLLNNSEHPTVDVIYKALSPDLPTLSKTTVYNTLNLFVEKGLVEVVLIEENETRYEIASPTHGHFKCQDCGTVYDLEWDDKEWEQQFLEGCKIEERHFYFKGICKHCMEQK